MKTILGQRPAFDRNDTEIPVDPEEADIGRTYATVIGLTVVASVTRGIDWAAYAVDSETGGIGFVLDYGDKLPEAAARALFPGVAERYRL